MMPDPDITRHAREVDALLKASRALLEYKEFDKTARAIFDQACIITGAKSGYVALLSDDGAENEVLFLEAGGMPCSVDENLPMPIRGLRSEAYRTNSVVYENDFMKSEWVKFMPAGHVVLKNVLFAPLVIDGKTMGIMGLANKEADFSERDAEIAATFGEFAALALANSRMMGELNDTVHELQAALHEVKTLKGIIPICMHCKKIKDSKGYWEQVEAYVQHHTEAEFSHGLCPDCVRELYPEYARKGDDGQT